MFNLTIRGHDLSNIRTPAELAQGTKSQGINNLQLALNASFPELNASKEGINPGMGTYFKNILMAEQIQVGILSCYSNLIHPEADQREAILQKFEVYLQHAKYFGASMVASETGSVIANLGYSEKNFSDAVFADLLQVLKRLVASGEKYNTLVAIEAGLNHPLSSLERIEQMLAEIDSPYLGVILDPTNLITVADYQKQVALVEQAFASFGAKICAFHLKDFVIKGNQIQPVGFGSGLLDWQAILKIIATYKPYSYVVLEETKDAGIGHAVTQIHQFEKTL